MWPGTHNGERTVSLADSSRRTGYPHVKQENWMLAYVTYKNKLKVHKRT